MSGPIGSKVTHISIKTENLEIGEKGVRSPKVMDDRKGSLFHAIMSFIHIYLKM